MNRQRALAADVATTLTAATDDHLIAVLGPHVLLHLPQPTRPDMVEAVAGVVLSRLEAALDGPDADRVAERRLHAALMAVTRAPQGESPGGAVGERAASRRV